MNKIIPEDIIINIIIPYTYQIIPKKLSFDIISFKKDLDLIENLYSFDYNYKILLNDLLIFCNTCIISDLLIRKHICKNILYNNKIGKYKNKIRLLWGLFSPQERNRFINDKIE